MHSTVLFVPDAAGFDELPLDSTSSGPMPTSDMPNVPSAKIKDQKSEIKDHSPSYLVVRCR
uniref:Uncharacterized protein n=1 Tax=Pristionchus pacificus TaxID=54126 RepID=A0A2A6C9B2_PRIPA|eukprot:PDM74668.1 hypothetical protein PRIPAC_42024 [Pristionchus pacificus]